MTATVTRLRPREFYAVVPGSGGGPGQDGKPEPVFYARTFDGLMSAIEHAKLLSRGGGQQDVTLTEGRRTRVILRFEDGADTTGKLLPPPYPAALRPAPGDIRPGSPKGHIPEICTTAKNRAAGRKPRRNPNCPRPEWPGIDITRK
jgi:hypothetical protein